MHETLPSSRAARTGLNHVFAVVLLACVALVTSCKRGPDFHYGFPAIHPKIRVVDDAGQPVSGGRVTVVTSYWYPTLFGSSKGRSFTDVFPPDEDGVATLTLRRHPQITKQEIAVEVGRKTVLKTRVDEDLDWATFEREPRRICVPASHAGRATRLYWRGSNPYEPKKYTVRLMGGPVQYSFAQGEFVDSGGDLLFIVERPDAGDHEKENRPVKLTIRPIGGCLQKMSQHEVIFGAEGPVAKWGDEDSLSLEAPNSRNRPAVRSAFGYSSIDGAKRALVSFHAHPVSERAGEEAFMSIAMWAKVDLH